jgi:hypothetical protein
MSDADYLVSAAAKAGIDPLQLATIMQYESGLNPTRWGGKGGNYFGLIQFGPEERKKFGVEPTNTNFNTQTDAAIKFLQSRGFRPGMSWEDMYSTVLAGRPGLLNRADQNGTVSQHVASMQNGAMKEAQKFLSGTGYQTPAETVSAPAPTQAPTSAANTQPKTLTDALQSTGVRKYATGLLNDSQPKVQDTGWGNDFQQSAQQFHQAQVANAMRGLLG